MIAAVNFIPPVGSLASVSEEEKEEEKVEGEERQPKFRDGPVGL